jgi:polyisoprenoid-binding protein YceI
VTKPVTLEIIFNGAGLGKDRQERMGFSADAQIRRSDFGATKYAPLVGDNVSVAIEVEFTKSSALTGLPQ